LSLLSQNVPYTCLGLAPVTLREQFFDCVLPYSAPINCEPPIRTYYSLPETFCQLGHNVLFIQTMHTHLTFGNELLICSHHNASPLGFNTSFTNAFVSIIGSFTEHSVKIDAIVSTLPSPPTAFLIASMSSTLHPSTTASPFALLKPPCNASLSSNPDIASCACARLQCRALCLMRADIRDHACILES
jgi:hypothetical protein